MKIIEDSYKPFGFFPSLPANNIHQPSVNYTTAVSTSTTSPLCKNNITSEITFNFSTQILCELITEYRDYQVLDPHTKAIIIAGYATLIAIGIVSNALVCFVVVRQTSHKSSHPLGGNSRNLYILNLALADLAMCLICMPLSLYDLLHVHWTLGAILCKTGPVIQATNILVSAGTITAIAVDRYNTIVRSPRTRGQPERGSSGVAAGIVIIWLASLLITSPLFFYTQIETIEISGIYSFDECIEQWPSHSFRSIFTIGLTSVQFVIPVLILSVIHFKISAYLKRHLKPFSKLKPTIEIHSPNEQRSEKCNKINFDDGELFPEEKQQLQKEFLYIKRKESICSDNSQRSESSRKYSDCSDSKRYSTPDISPRKRSDIFSDFSFSFSRLSRESSKKKQKNVRRELSRNRRTTLLLSCIAAVYAISWLPYQVYNIVINLYPQEFEPAIIYKAFAAVHLIAMTSVCVNPFLYGWLNTNFRCEFLHIYSSMSVCFSKLFKKSSIIINKNANYSEAIYKVCEEDLKKKTVLSMIPTNKPDCVMVAILNESGQIPRFEV